MAIAATVINGSGAGELSTTNATSYAFTSFTITSGRPTLAIIQSAENNPSTVPLITASGHGSTYTWTNEGSIQMDAGVRRRLTVFSALPSSTTTDVLTVNFSTGTQFNCSLHAVEFTGADTTDIIRQVVTNFGSTFGTVTVTMAAFGTATNATFGVFSINNTTSTLTAGTGFTGLTSLSTSEVEAPTRVITQFRNDNDTSVTADISGTTNRRWIGVGVELKEAPATDTIVAVTAEAAGDGVVPVATVGLTAVLGEAAGVALVASIPVAVLPTGILGDADIIGPAYLGNFTLAGTGAPAVITLPIVGVTATSIGVGIVPGLGVAALPPAATADADTPDDPPVITATVLATAVASGLGVGIVPVVKVTEIAVLATADGVALVASISSASAILSIAASALAVGNVPVITIGLTSAVATGTADGITVSLSVTLDGVTADSIATAIVPAVGELEVAVTGEVGLRALTHEHLELGTVTPELLDLRTVIEERCALEAIIL